MRAGGTTSAARNLISGNGTGILIESGVIHIVQGNFIGTNARPPARSAICSTESPGIVEHIGGTTTTRATPSRGTADMASARWRNRRRANNLAGESSAPM
jgi:hypothetical protein